jgi:hypothetical protein
VWLKYKTLISNLSTKSPYKKMEGRKGGREEKKGVSN